MEKMERKNTNRSGPIVMVDDNEIDLDIARRFYAFSDLKNPFLPLPSGSQLLDYLAKVRAGEEEAPALVLLDVNMPGMDGFDVLSEVRRQECFKEQPSVIMLTNSDNPRDMEKALTLGANGYQQKYFELQKFVDFFNSLIPAM